MGKKISALTLMKSLSSLLLLAVLALPTALPAVPFAVRPLPAGFDSGKVNVTLLNETFVTPPQAVDFIGNGKKQWYAGGKTISLFPESGTVTLPSYTLPEWLPATLEPMAGIPLDVDGDGDMDIFRINSWGGMGGYYTMVMLENQGNAAFTVGWRMDFQHTPSFAAGYQSYQLAAGDFNGDGRVDVGVLRTYKLPNNSVTPNREEGALSIRWNDGTGKFPTATTLQSTGFTDIATLGAGDLDNDGDIDLACGPQMTYDNEGLVTWSTRFFDNNGAGVFTVSGAGFQKFWWGTTPVDLNRDGWLDLANGVSVIWNPKNGSVGSFSSDFSPPWAGRREAHAFDDFDGDGAVDLINAIGKTLTLLPRVNSYGSDPPVTLATFGSDIVTVSGADSDADGDVDALVLLRNGTFVFMENQSHHWAPGAQLVGGQDAAYALAGVTQLETADFNRDGRDDLLAVTPSQKRLWTLNGRSEGIPDAPLFKNTQNVEPGAATITDLDNDGMPDIAYTLPASGAVRWARNNGPTPFAWTDTVIASDLPGVNLITAGQHGSPNGRDELLTSSGTTGQLRWLYRSGSIWNGQNVLSSSSPVPQAILARNLASGAGEEPFCLSIGNGSLRVRGFQLSGPWTSFGDFSQTVTATPHHAAMTWGDLNADGRNEIVFVRGDGNVAYWTPGSPITFSLGTAPSAIRAIRVVDWNRDGRQDVLCATATGLSLYYWKGGWQREDLHTMANGYTRLSVLDLNHDGWPDAAVTDGSKIFFYINTPRVLHAIVQGSAAVALNPGEQGLAMQIAATHPGRGYQVGTTWLSDVGAAATGAGVRLHKAVLSDGQWVKGPALTSSEFSSIATGLSLLADGAVVGSSGPQLLESGGILPIAYNSVLGNLITIPGGETRPLHIRVNLRADASQSPITRFFLTLDSLNARVLGGAGTDRYVPLASASTNSVLVSIVPDYTPLQQWRATYFGSPDAVGTRANDADYDGDGVPNLVEYAAGTNPAAAEPALNAANGLTLLPFASAQAPAKCRAVFSGSALADPKVRLSIQTSAGLGGWATLASRTGGGSWTGLQPDSAIPANGSTTCIFTSTYKPESTTSLFLRLKAEELP